MQRSILHLLATITLFLSATVAVSAPQVPAAEWRSVWVSRFEWPKGNQQEISARLTRMMGDLAAANLNAVIFQVRGQGDTLYPSADEPWSPMIASGSRGFDPVDVAIREARKNGLQFHAWINLSVIWQSADHKLPADRNHPFYRFADARNSPTRKGLIHDAAGRPVQFGADNYVWLTHGDPEVNAYLRRQVASFLAKHQVDGLHMDDRTGAPNGVSRDPVSVARFNGRGNPMHVRDLGEWQRDQLTRFLSDLYVQCKAANPRLLISISPFGIADRTRIPSYGKFSDAVKFGIEPEKWLRLGVVDALIPQIYWNEADPAPNFSIVLKDWLSHNHSGRPIWPGSSLGKSQPLATAQQQYVSIARSLGAGGNSFFSYGGATSAQWRSDLKSVYASKARVPIPAHMLPGQTGQIMGIIKNSAGNSVVDCWIQIKGSSMIYLSSADGFFGIPNLKPGVYTLQISGPSGAPVTKEASVSADQTARVDITLN